MSLMQDRRSTVDVSATYDEGLRSYMLRVYNYMASGVALSGIVGMLLMSSPELVFMLFGGSSVKILLFMGVLVGYSFLVLGRIESMSRTGAMLAFFGYAALFGSFFSVIGLMYTGESIIRVFLISASLFASMSLYGYTTKKDLTSLGSFLTMGAIGLLIAIVVNLFLQSSMMSMVISCVAVLVFTVMTAYDTQKIKRVYYTVGSQGEALHRASVIGALQLYGDFVVIFIHLMHLLGDRR